MGRTVAITGVNSYFASTVLPRLQADPDIDTIIGIDITPWKGGFSKVTFHRVDIRSHSISDILKGVDVLYHLAFIVGEIHDKQKTYDINVSGSKNVFRACVENKIKKVIYTSSTTVYGAHKDNPIGFDETRLLNQNKDSYYSSSKVEVEGFIATFFDDHPDIILTVLRAALLCGPHMNNFFHKLYSMPVLALTMGRSPFQHYIHEEDLGEALYCALKKDLPGVYNVGADDAVPAAWAFKMAGVRAIHLPSPILKGIMNIAFALHLLPASQGWVSLSEYTIFPNSNKFKKATGWEPRHSSAETFLSYLKARTREHDTLIQKTLSWIFKSGARTRPTMTVLHVFRLGKIPWIRDRIPWMNPKKNSMTYLPINTSLGQTVEQVLPPQVVHDFIDKADIHVIMDTCGCRLARECKHYTPAVGCLFMGETALKLPHGISRRVTREQAHAHLDRAIEVGLVPMTGKVRVDNFIFLTPDESKLLSVCFCCHCCCMMTSLKHIPATHLDKLMPPVEGLRVEVTDQCIGCGTCLETCGFGAISLVNGRAVHNAQCRGCGRCERFCPNHAVRISVDRKDYTREVENRIMSYVDISGK